MVVHPQVVEIRRNKHQSLCLCRAQNSGYDLVRFGLVNNSFREPIYQTYFLLEVLEPHVGLFRWIVAIKLGPVLSSDTP
jgi:hypothetical protein